MRRPFILLVCLGLAVGCSNAPDKGANAATNDTPNNTANNAQNSANNIASNNAVLPPGSCEDAPPVPDGAATCRDASECDVGEACALLPQTEVACGASCAPILECQSDDECAASEVCRLFTQELPCCGAVWGNTHCDAPCEPGECTNGTRCEEDGHCRTIPCGDGWDCSATFVCDPDRAGADDHGCALGDCEVDDIECPTDHVCDGTAQWADSRNCAPVRCEDGYQCPPNQGCESSVGNHGCAPRPCDADGDCDCGACIQGICQPRLFVCSQQAF